MCVFARDCVFPRPSQSPLNSFARSSGCNGVVQLVVATSRGVRLLMSYAFSPSFSQSASGAFDGG